MSAGDDSARMTAEIDPTEHRRQTPFMDDAGVLDPLEVFGREATLGDDGFNGSGGGARPGSELSHLLLVISHVLEDI